MRKGLFYSLARVVIALSLVFISLFSFLVLTPLLSADKDNGNTLSLSRLPPQLAKVQTFIHDRRTHFSSTSQFSTMVSVPQKKKKIFLSIIILTYNNAPLVNRTLSALLAQQHLDPSSNSGPGLIPPWRWEVLLVDNGCFLATREVFNHYHRHHAINTASGSGSGSGGQHKHTTSTLQYIPLCNNTRYSVANNLAASQYVAPSTEWLLFLNDDVVPQQKPLQRGSGGGGSFLWNFYSLLAAHSRPRLRPNTSASPPSSSGSGSGQHMSGAPQHEVGAVGCKLLFGGESARQHKIVEAGSIILANGKTDNYLR